ncbi:hypothetical protein GPA10_04930 [Streptomyces sp. p1417]|uniref:Uncharacterized protein n=1 Tax=Streptomyces typhae TaxID=2681492 RepID=A0A6L6WQ05_9ACTN|nr:hypothetical protein [Streptomyces typhae]MVO84130.1 hypothetical protein [Streptomyces typhae]
MSAPTSHDPVAVNTRDGVAWLRRAVTVDGRALYAMDGAVMGAPEFVLATLEDLAERGITGSADVLPMPVGPAPQTLREADELAVFRALELGDVDGRVSASCGKPGHPTWLRKVDDTRACPWCVMDLQNDSLVARTHQLALYQEMERNFWGNQRVDESLAAVANRRIAELNEERDKLRARVAELEAEKQQASALGAAAEERLAARIFGDEATADELPEVEVRAQRAALLAMLPKAPPPVPMPGQGPELRAAYGVWERVAGVLGVELPQGPPMSVAESSEKLRLLFAGAEAMGIPLPPRGDDSPEAGDGS